MKRLVICFDGTWNSADAERADTNVALLARAIHATVGTGGSPNPYSICAASELQACKRKSFSRVLPASGSMRISVPVTCLSRRTISQGMKYSYLDSRAAPLQLVACLGSSTPVAY